MKFLRFLRCLFTLPSLVDRIGQALERIEANQWSQAAMLAALTDQGVTMSNQIIESLKEVKEDLKAGFTRLENEVLEMAAKLEGVTDLSEVVPVVAELKALAVKVNELRATVDTDGSNAPAEEQQPEDGTEGEQTTEG